VLCTGDESGMNGGRTPEAFEPRPPRIHLLGTSVDEGKKRKDRSC
jgi:hypothetical protein